MTSYVRWQGIRSEHVERAGGEDVIAAGEAGVARLPGRGTSVDDGDITAIA